MPKAKTDNHTRCVRLQVEGEKHDRIKHLRNAIQYQRKTDISLIDMYQQIVDAGILTAFAKAYLTQWVKFELE